MKLKKVKTSRTLEEFLIERQYEFKHSTGELSRLLNSILLAARIVSHRVKKAGLVNITGSMGITNVQGEEQKKLDAYANEVFIQTLIHREIVCGIASEENDNFIEIKGLDEGHNNKYVVLMDPLDGSSNIEVNISIGSIFSIYKRLSPIGTPVQPEDFLQPGIMQVAAGYILYGTSTMFILTTGNGVNGFTLNPDIGSFYLSHPDMKFPAKGNVYSVNEGNYVHFPQAIKQYIKYCQEEKDDRPYSARYVGSLVSDCHRNIIKGGIYLYPSTAKAPSGKLRLLYECNPIAFITEQAGGAATNGLKRILEIKPEKLHQRTPFYCGSKEMVEKVMEFISL